MKEREREDKIMQKGGGIAQKKSECRKNMSYVK